MPVDDLTSISRRSIVKTGARLAYAAPVVAASMTLTAPGASAQVSPGTGGPDPECAGGNACLGTPTCGQPGSNCSCATLVEGGSLCRPTVADCDTPIGCDTNADCAAIGSARPYCVIADDCCPQAGFAGVCTGRCPTP
jgi:hypothetical protein